MVHGEQELLRKINNLSVDLDQATDETVLSVAMLVRGQAIKSIQKISSGETVSRSRQGGGTYKHVASKPGDAPNTDTGSLVRSIAVEHEKGSKVAFVGTSIMHGKYLELGTRDIEPRPWLMPATDKGKPLFPVMLEKALDRQIEKATK